MQIFQQRQNYLSHKINKWNLKYWIICGFCKLASYGSDIEAWAKTAICFYSKKEPPVRQVIASEKCLIRVKAQFSKSYCIYQWHLVVIIQTDVFYANRSRPSDCRCQIDESNVSHKVCCWIDNTKSLSL